MKETLKRETAFMGRITAGVTHELKNVLAIIRESAGLIEDILAMGQDAAARHQDKVTRALSNISQQVNRGVDLSSKLNAFAHSSDETRVGADLNILVAQVAELSARFARLKAVKLVAKAQPDPVLLVTDPLKLQMLLVEAIDLMLKTIPSGSTIHIEPDNPEKGAVSICFRVDDPQGNSIPPSDSEPEQSSDWSVIKELAAGLEGALQTGSGPAWFSVVFRS